MTVIAKLIAGVVGALSCGFLAFVVFALVSGFQVNRAGYTPEATDRLTDVFVFASPVILGLGAWLGIHLHNRWRRGVHKRHEDRG